MNKFEFKYLNMAETFFIDGIEFTKTSHERGYFFNENGRKVFRNFKKKKLIETESKRWDIDGIHMV